MDASGLSFPTWEWVQLGLGGKREVKLAWGPLDLQVGWDGGFVHPYALGAGLLDS